jgi:hypothetical protein
VAARLTIITTTTLLASQQHVSIYSWFYINMSLKEM